MEKIIIYGSQYGTASRYAEELGKRTGAEVRIHTDVKDLDRYSCIVYIGALYAGGVLGMKKTFAGMTDVTDKTILIATVGLADPGDKENVASIEQGMERQLPKEVYENAKLFHLRGGIDYSRLGFRHKTMMALLYRKAKGLPEEKKTAEVRAMIETYGQVVDFVDFDSLQPLIDAI